MRNIEMTDILIVIIVNCVFNNLQCFINEKKKKLLLLKQETESIGIIYEMNSDSVIAFCHLQNL